MDAAHGAFTHGLRLTATIGCVLMILVAVFAASMLRRLQAAGPDTKQQSEEAFSAAAAPLSGAQAAEKVGRGATPS